MYEYEVLFFMVISITLLITVVVVSNYMKEDSYGCGCGPMCECNGTLTKFVWLNDSFQCPCEERVKGASNV